MKIFWNEDDENMRTVPAERALVFSERAFRFNVSNQTHGFLEQLGYEMFALQINSFSWNWGSSNLIDAIRYSKHLESRIKPLKSRQITI